MLVAVAMATGGFAVTNDAGDMAVLQTAASLDRRSVGETAGWVPASCTECVRKCSLAARVETAD